jgi:amidase
VCSQQVRRDLRAAIEDRLNAWTWKCRIEAAAGGVLDGKTVSYKDHIAVAGVPLSFGSFALEGFVPDFDATVGTRVCRREARSSARTS